MYPEAVSKLAAMFRKLPSVGTKTAMRYAYKIIEMSDEEANDLIEAIKDVKKNIHFCKECGTYTDKDICDRCMVADKSIICVVKEPKDIEVFEKIGAFNGVFHVLHGTIDFQKQVLVDNIRIKELIDRLDGVKEVIIATNTDVSGEMTASYLAQLIKPMNIKVTRLASGIPMGTEIEYADEHTLSQALIDRKEI
ncbi:MAG TPA: recombination protein RecR [Clostridiales bacterium]|nr:recombination protein RecR [Clostridiales bacterium]